MCQVFWARTRSIPGEGFDEMFPNVRRTADPTSATLAGEMDKNLPRAFRMIVVLGVLSLFTMGLSVLALADIYHGGEDLTAEWRMLQISCLLQVGFVSVVLGTVYRYRRTLRS